MPESPRRVDLRLTIPADAPYMAVAVELAGKFAEYSGAGASAVQDLARALDAAIAPVAAASPGTPIDLEMTAQGTELVVTASSGSITKRATCPLPD
jgi:hypothetical protein